jgi:hypothetical protein
LWGPPAISGTVDFDANGFPIDPVTLAPAGSVSISLLNTQRAQLQTDWPIPTRWELQFGLVLTPLSGPFPTWPGAQGTFSLNGEIQGSIESATVVQVFSLVDGPGAYPFQAAAAGTLGLGSTFPIVAQQVRAFANSVTLRSDPALSGLTPSRWSWAFTAMAGITSPAVF